VERENWVPATPNSYRQSNSYKYDLLKTKKNCTELQLKQKSQHIFCPPSSQCATKFLKLNINSGLNYCITVKIFVDVFS
jgi:hypothetical protein